MIIAVAEDDEISERYVSILATTFGKEILKAQNGQEIIDLCHKNPGLVLILMDIKMPIMNGYEATPKIRESNKEIIIIAQTGYAIAGNREKAIAAGCNDYIEKPVGKDVLIQMIQKYFSKD